MRILNATVIIICAILAYVVVVHALLATLFWVCDSKPRQSWFKHFKDLLNSPYDNDDDEY